MQKKKTILVDFDGVVNSYESEWCGVDVLPDPPVDKAIEWLTLMCNDPRFDTCIYSSRSANMGGQIAMKKWLVDHGLSKHLVATGALRFPTTKPPAWMTIDDRGFHFTGEFPTPDEIAAFKPWWKK